MGLIPHKYDFLFNSEDGINCNYTKAYYNNGKTKKPRISFHYTDIANFT